MQEEEREYYISIGDRMDCVRDAKECWSLVKDLRRASFRCGMWLTCWEFREHFDGLPNSSLACVRVAYEMHLSERLGDWMRKYVRMK